MFILSKSTDIIGRGSHWDKIAQEAIGRKQRIDNTDIFITECGLGASGFPHIGSFADASRAYAVKVAVQDTGRYDTEFYAYADNLDGLRKVPAGLPETLNEWIGVPVSHITDPFECHESYGNHMVSLLLDSLDEANIAYSYQSAAELYERGKFTEQIRKILSNTDRIGQIIFEETGQEKYLEEIPYHPICENCGKIYTTTVTDLDIDNNRVRYRCESAVIRKNDIKGCGN